jgi:hypothetical protein
MALFVMNAEKLMRLLRLLFAFFAWLYLTIFSIGYVERWRVNASAI